MAAALGRELGGPLCYGSVAEDRPRLGHGPRPDPEDVPTAVGLADRAEWIGIALLCLVGLASVLWERIRRTV